jgi:hypothetical protein
MPWSASVADEHRLDALSLLARLRPSISLQLVDAAGQERLFVSRIGLNRIESSDDLSARPRGAGCPPRAGSGSARSRSSMARSPSMTIAVAGNRSAVGVAIAEVNLKFIWDVISAIRVGRTGEAFVLDRPGRLVAHPDISLVLRADDSAPPPLRALREAVLLTGPGQAATGQDLARQTVLAAMAQIPGVDWSVIVKQPIAEAYRPIYAALWRTAALLVAGAALAVGARLPFDLAHGRAIRLLGGWSRSHRRRQFAHGSGWRPATNSSGWQPGSTLWPASCRSRRNAPTASAASSASSRPQGRRTRSTASETSASSMGAGRSRRGVLRSAGLHRLLARAEPETQSSACCANTTTRSNGTGAPMARRSSISPATA